MNGSLFLLYLLALLAGTALVTICVEWAWRRFQAWHEARLKYPWEGGE